MSTPHPLILAELTKYRGGEFVPRHLSTMLLVYDTDLSWWAWRSETRGDQCDIEDAHAHIELAAIEVANTEGMFLMKSAETYAVTRDVGHCVLWHPTRADALLAAVKGINAKENA